MSATSHQLPILPPLPFACWRHEQNVMPLYEAIWDALEFESEPMRRIASGKELLKSLGFSNKERKLFWRLSHEEARILAERIPTDDDMIRAYFVEVRRALPMLELHRRHDASIVGPYMIPALADALLLQACLVNGLDNGYTQISWQDLTRLAPDSPLFAPSGPTNAAPERFMQVIMATEDKACECVPLALAQRLIAGFVDTLITHSAGIDWAAEIEQKATGCWCPPQLQTLLASPRDILHWLSRTEWFHGERLFNQDWGTLMSLSQRWQELNHFDDDYGEYSQVSSWPCEIADHYTEWQSTLPDDLPYDLHPLASADELDAEAAALNSLVWSFQIFCACGEYRAFSIREKSSGKRLGTLLLERDEDTGQWQTASIYHKGDNLLDFWKMENPAEAMRGIGILSKAAAAWYNRHSTPPQFSCTFEFVAATDQQGLPTTGEASRSLYALTIHPQHQRDGAESFIDLCLKQGFALLGLGHAGLWPECKAKLRAEGWTTRQIAGIRRFAMDVREGDLIALRSGKTTIATGIVTGGYEWRDEFEGAGGWEIQHVRGVQW